MKSRLFIPILLFSFFAYGQNKLNDKHIVNQHKRMVFEEWAPMTPKAQKLFGIPTNAAYWLIWGDLAPKRNKKYKKGPDIRPLKPTGHESLRLLELHKQQKFAEEILQQADTVTKEYEKDFMHNTSTTVEADPLWQLYYKKQLKPLVNFPSNPQNYTDWNFETNNDYQKAVSNGSIQNLRTQLNLMKSNFKISRNTPMPRGKRILLYHQILMDWRKFVNSLSFTNKKYNNNDYYKNISNGKSEYNSINSSRTDEEIITDTMNQLKQYYND
ncbi:MAG TPA: hypothetical protein VNJ50_13600 [Gelidibacter sp.]|uniref:hypothetical protein n=1 Tax=Gelidibacter sp. TaxID=2018083 RepID=UPI002CE7BE62|nr:hypothetical protein [Gelidibacter sp.]HXJ99882.1 hypothetical protein [Gelidibacter sp.]